MLVEQTQGREKDPRANATWLHTTFTSTQHFLQERWGRASKQHSRVPNTSQPAKAHKSGRCTSARAALCLLIVFKARGTLFLVLLGLTHRPVSAGSELSDSWLGENKHRHPRLINWPFGPEVLRSNCSNMSLTEAVCLKHNPVDIRLPGRNRRSPVL